MLNGVDFDEITETYLLEDFIDLLLFDRDRRE